MVRERSFNSPTAPESEFQTNHFRDARNKRPTDFPPQNSEFLAAPVTSHYFVLEEEVRAKDFLAATF